MKNIVVLTTTGPGNLLTVIEFVQKYSDFVRLIHIFSDLPQSPSFITAQYYNIPYSHIHIGGDLSNIESKNVRQKDCDVLLLQLKSLEQRYGKIDCIVSAFRKILVGDIIHEYAGRLINVHPADLTVYDIHTRKRRYTGIEGLHRAICDDNNPHSRTTVHYIDSGIDTGEIIAMGDDVIRLPEESLDDFEQRQKKYSDKTALTRALEKIMIMEEI